MRNPQFRRRLLATTMITGALAATAMVATAAPAFAQDADETEVEEIVVTGSRIRVRDTTGSSPIVTVAGEQLSEIGTGTIETYLNSLPQLSPNLTKTNNNPTGGGAAFLDLRQLGSARGLVLVDGRRLVPGSSSGAVDVSILPGALVDRVEIITGGASAVYGADAVTGVVNFLLQDDFEGLTFSSQYGTSEENDGQEWQYNLLAGGSFADGRGHATFAASYNQRDEIAQSARDFTRDATYCFNDGTCIPNGSYTTGDGTFSLGGANATPEALARYEAYFVERGYNPASDLLFPGQRLGFNPDGSLFIAGVGDGTFGYTGPNTGFFDPSQDFQYNFNPVNLLQSGFERLSTYTTFDYDITDNIEFYGSALFATYESANALAESPAGFSIPVATTGTLDPEVQALMLANGVSAFTLSRRTVELGPRSYDFDTTAYQVSAGIRGDLPELLGNTWSYDVYASYGKYENRIEYGGFPEGNRIRAALAGCPVGSPIGPVGANGSTTPCVPLDPFGANNITADQVEYIVAKGQFEQIEIDQSNVVASITGDLFQLPAGAVGFAAGIEYREIGYSDIPPEGVQTGSLLGGNAAGPVTGGYNVWEVFSEVRVPILADLPFVHYLGLEGGYRASEYSIGQTTDTWKYGGEYAPFEWLRFRALQQQAVRAPSVGELYATRAEGFPGQTSGNLDPCDSDSDQRNGANASQVLALCQAQSPEVTASFNSAGTQYRTFSGGNPNLSPETAKSFTVGAVLSAPSFAPSFLSSLVVTLDYFDIEIEDVISSVGFSTSLDRCYSADYNPTFTTANAYCQNIVRDPETGLLTSVGLNGYISATAANLGALVASGIDLSVAYNLTLADYGMPAWTGRLSFTTQGTWNENQQFQALPGDPFSDSFVGTIGDGTPGATALPEYKFNTRIAWSYEDISLSLRWQYIDSMIDPAADVAGGDIGSIDAYNYFYLNGSYALTDTFEIFGGVDNLTDKEAPKYASGFQYQTDPSTYDVIGRYYYVGVRARF